MERLPCSTQQTLTQFWKKHYTPSNICVVGVNVDHEQFTRLVDKHFVFQNTAPVVHPHYGNEIVKGGSYFVDFPAMDMTEVDLGFHTDGWLAKDMVTLNLLQMVLGGGQMFSAGGPGKGMYSRLYKVGD